MSNTAGRWLPIAALGLITLALYGQTLGHGFVYDDMQYVSLNPMVLRGLSPTTVAWAWTTGEQANWHPLTWMSLQLDATLFGTRPLGFRLSNILWHVANTALLYVFFLQTTRRIGMAAWIAGVFALHPLHVESVAWIAERKDTLSVFFGLGALLAYARYVAAPTWANYSLVAVGMLLSLLAKQTLVTLPCLLLLLDVWPFRRLDPFAPTFVKTLVDLVREKLPLFALAAAFSVIIVIAQSAGGALVYDDLAFPLRLKNAAHSVRMYVQQSFWPTGLSVHYPYPVEGLSTLELAIALVVLAGVTAAVLVAVFGPAVRRRNVDKNVGETKPSKPTAADADTRPADVPWYLPVGWFWFVGTLVPMLGIVQVGSQARADRYMYFPLIGLSVLVAFGVGRWLRGVPAWTLGMLSLAALAFLTHEQCKHWQSNMTLFAHAVAVTKDNDRALAKLAGGLLEQAALAEQRGDQALAQEYTLQAEQHAQAALALNTNDPAARINLAYIAFGKQDWAAELAVVEPMVAKNDRDAKAFGHYGNALWKLGKPEEADEYFLLALARDPADGWVRNQYAVMLASTGRIAEAIRQMEWMVRANPTSTTYLFNLAQLWARAGEEERAVQIYRHILTLDPHHQLTLTQLRSRGLR